MARHFQYARCAAGTYQLYPKVHFVSIPLFAENNEYSYQFLYNSGDIPIHALPMDSAPMYLQFAEQFENERLSHALRQLNKQDRYIFFSRVLGEKSWKELAAELSMSYGAVAMSYHRTVKRLRTMLKE